MPPVIRLKEFIDELYTVSDEVRVFLNIRTGKIVLLTSEVLYAAEECEDFDDFPDWEKEMVKEAQEVLDSEDYRQLPERFEIDDYSIMESFCHSIEDEKLKARLLRSIRGKGAFRHFRDMVDACGIEEAWYTWRENGLKEIAREWLEQHGLEYTDEN